MARDMIAVLDGLGAAAVSPSASGGANYSGGGAFPGGVPVLPSGEWGLAAAAVNPSASGGGNYSGGGAFPGGVPVLPSGDWGLAAVGRALAEAALPTGVFPEGPDSWNEGWVPNGVDAGEAVDDYSSYLAAFNGNRVATMGRQDATSSYDLQAVQISPSASGGANYSGGASFPGGVPLLPSGAWGLAAVRRRAAIKALAGLGASPRTIVAAVRAAMDRPVTGTPCDQAFKTAFNAALAAGYDRQWASSAANRVLNQCMSLGYSQFSTRA
jgi:hypothetical protein